MSNPAHSTPDAADDPRIDAQIRPFLAMLNKDSSPFWELPQPRPQDILTGLQSQTPVDMSGVTTTERIISQDGRTVKLYIMKPERVSGTPGVLFFVHGGVWIVGNFQNHQRLLRDLVVGSGQVGVFVEYTPLPSAKFPTQVEGVLCRSEMGGRSCRRVRCRWEPHRYCRKFGRRQHERGASSDGEGPQGPQIRYQVLMVPATDASVDTESYKEYGTGRFLARAFMKYGWDLYAPDPKTRDNPYVSPLRASLDQLRGLPPALVITAENCPLRDEGEAYARKLKAAGVSVDAVRYNGTIHDFVLLNALRNVPSTEAAIEQVSEGVRQHLEAALD